MSFRPEAVKKILVVRNDNLGDVICTTPALEALRKTFPLAHIAVLVASYTREAVEGNPHVDRVYSYDKAKHSKGSLVAAWLRQWRVMREIQRQRFDMAIGIRAKFTLPQAWLVFLSRARFRVGHYPKDKGRAFWFFYNIYAEPGHTEEHEVERALNVVRAIGADIGEKRLVLSVPREDDERASAFVRENGLKDNKKLVCLHITSRMEEKRWWPVESYARVIDSLMSRGRVSLVLNWLPKDEGLAIEVMAGLKERPLVYNVPSLKGFAAFLGHADLFITLEGGAMHIGAAMGTPTIAIFGKTLPSVWAPWGANNISLKNGDHASSVSPEDVLAACEGFLRGAHEA